IGNLIALGGMTQAELWEPWAETRGGPPPQFACAAEAEPARVTTLIAAASPALPAWLPDVEEEVAELAELLAGPPRTYPRARRALPERRGRLDGAHRRGAGVRRGTRPSRARRDAAGGAGRAPGSVRRAHGGDRSAHTLAVPRTTVFVLAC